MRTPSADLQAKLLLAAELFARDGYEATSLTDVAAATGVSRTQLYYYFDSKRELLEWTIEKMFTFAAEVSAKVIVDTVSASRSLDVYTKPGYKAQVMTYLDELTKDP